MLSFEAICFVADNSAELCILPNSVWLKRHALPTLLPVPVWHCYLNVFTFQQTRTAGLHWYWRCGRQTWAIATILWHLASTHRRGSFWWPCSKGSSLHGNLPGVQKPLQRPSGLTSSTCGVVGRCVLARNRTLSIIEWGEEEKARLNLVVIVDVTLLGTNISPPKVCLKMIFLFPRWDIFFPWRVCQYIKYHLLCVIIPFGSIRSKGSVVRISWWRLCNALAGRCAKMSSFLITSLFGTVVNLIPLTLIAKRKT